MVQLTYNGIKCCCDYCNRRFQDGDEIWVSGDKVICRPDPNKKCNATHIGDFRTGAWDCMVFRKATSPST